MAVTIHLPCCQRNCSTTSECQPIRHETGIEWVPARPIGDWRRARLQPEVRNSNQHARQMVIYDDCDATTACCMMSLAMDADECCVLECWEGERHEAVFSRGSAMFSGTVSANSLNLELRKAIGSHKFHCIEGVRWYTGVNVVDIQHDGRLQYSFPILRQAILVSGRASRPDGCASNSAGSSCSLEAAPSRRETLDRLKWQLHTRHLAVAFVNQPVTTIIESPPCSDGSQLSSPRLTHLMLFHRLASSDSVYGLRWP